jgi:DNA invertase Pin-like site-specific DNA recombinase
MKVGYARASTTDHSLDLQIDALRRAGCRNHIFEESISTPRLKHPELDRCLARLKKGDTLVIYKLGPPRALRPFSSRPRKDAWRQRHQPCVIE